MKKVPELRFAGFEGEWEEKKIKDLAEFYSGGTPTSDNSSYYNGSIPFIRSGEIHSNTTELYISEEGLSNSSAKMVNKGDLVYALYGATSGEADIIRMSGAINQAILAIILEDEYNPIFTLNYLNKNKNKILSKYLQGGQGNLSGQIVRNIDITIPKSSEQEKIGDLFKKLDDLIEIQESKVSKMEAFKKSMAQKMFPKKDELVPVFRFDGFDGEWENVYVKDIGSFLGGTSIESHFNKKGKYKVISIGSYSNNSKYIDQGLRVDLNDKTKSKLLSKDDLAMVLNDKTTQGNIIGRALLIDEDNKYIFNQRTQRISPNFDKYNSLFLYYLFNSAIFRNKIKKISQGNTQIYINWPNVESIPLKIPSKNEQDKIGQFFKNLDTQIENEEKLLDSYKMMKKSLLQKMFV